MFNRVTDASDMGDAIRAVARTLIDGRRWLLASHQNPDGDAIGALVGLGLILEGIGKEVVMLNPTGVPDLYAFLPGSERIVTELAGKLDFDGIVILDSGHFSRIGPMSKRLDEFPVVVNIDHHVPDEPWGDLRWVDTSAPAVGLMIHTLARLLPARITPEAAANLYTAIMTDTGSFRYGNTTPQALVVASELIELGADPALCARRVYLTYSPGRLKLLASVLASLETELDGRLAITSVDLDTLEETGAAPAELDGFTDFIRGLPGAEVAALMRQEKEGYKLSLRSAGRVDVARLARGLGGGGHRMAAGAFIDGTKEQAKAALIEAARRAIHG